MSSLCTSPWVGPTSLDGRVRSLLTWSSSDKERLRDLLAGCLKDWCSYWGVSLQREAAAWISIVEPGFEGWQGPLPAAAGTEKMSRWALFPPSSSAELKIGAGDLADAGVHALAVLLCGETAAVPPREPSLTHALAVDAWADCYRRLQVMLGQADESLAMKGIGQSELAWSGVIDVHWHWGEMPWLLRLSNDVVAALLGTHTTADEAPSERGASSVRLTQLNDALGLRTMTLLAQLKGVDLTLGQLQQLRVGDIVPLSHLLEQPLAVKTPEGATVCEAWLGQVGSQMSLELAALTSPSPASPRDVHQSPI